MSEDLMRDLMRYDRLAHNALRGVVRESLRIVEKSGLPGEHHFYITFDTKHSGVSIGERMAQKYPREMTIVLQHQFFNLTVTEERFSVELSFDNILEKLSVPFSAIKRFVDPSVQFGLEFEVVTIEEPQIIENMSEPHKLATKTKPKLEATESTADENETPAPDAMQNKETPKVISLDAFRKK